MEARGRRHLGVVGSVPSYVHCQGTSQKKINKKCAPQERQSCWEYNKNSDSVERADVFMDIPQQMGSLVKSLKLRGHKGGERAWYRR